MARIYVNGDPNANQGGGGGFKQKTPGVYDLRIDSQESAESKAGIPKLVLKATIIAADNGQHVGDVVTLHESLSDKMAWRVKALLDATGVDYETGPGGKGLSFYDDHLVGRCFRSRLELEPKDGGGNWERWQDLAPSRFNAAAQVAPAPTHQAYPAPVAAPPQAYQPPPQQAQAPVQQPMHYPPGYTPPQAR